MKLDEIDEAVTLEKIIDNEIEAAQIEEDILKELELQEMQVSNNQLYKTLLDINDSIITSKREELIIDNKIFRAIEKVQDTSSSVDKKFNKTIYALWTVFFVLGVLIGMNDDTWLPYVSNILDFARTATNVVRG